VSITAKSPWAPFDELVLAEQVLVELVLVTDCEAGLTV